MKHEWKKHEKEIYMPKSEPVKIAIPRFKFFTLQGAGNPNDEAFAQAIGALYAVSYGVKMLPKKGIVPEGYFEYTVYPLEGVWDLTDAGRAEGAFDKNELVYTIMIRQPDFVQEELAAFVVEATKKKKPHPLLDKIKFESIEDGPCVQMMHVGPFDDEPQSFSRMKAFCAAHDLEQKDLRHREIYISDFRKTAPQNLKTVLRYFVR